MKYAITGSAGNISKPITLALLAAGHEVTILGRNESNLAELVAAGAKPAIGSIEDGEFVKKAFEGADAVYLMVPPNFETKNWIELFDRVGAIYVAAIKANNIKFAVTLSSVGAHLPTGAGPVSGLNHIETLLNEVEDLNVKYLRPGYFYHNFFGMKDMIKQGNILGSNYGGNGEKVTLVHPADIAKVAIEELLNLDFKGKSVRYIVADLKTGSEIAAILGKAIGKPELPWIEFSNEDALKGLLQAGVPEEQASGYVEMGECMRSGKMAEDYFKHEMKIDGISFEAFAAEFAAAYKQ